MGVFEIPNCQTIFEASHEMLPLHCFTNLEGYDSQVHIFLHRPLHGPGKICNFQQLLCHSLTQTTRRSPRTYFDILCVDRAPSNGRFQQPENTWCLLEVFSSLYDMNLCKPCIGPSLWSLAPHAPSFSTLTPAEDASFPLLRFMFSFQLLNFCGVAAWSYFANHQFRKQGHLGGFHGQPIIYAFEGHLRSSMSVKGVHLPVLEGNPWRLVGFVYAKNMFIMVF